MPMWLLSAVTERDLPRVLLLLAHSTKEQINHRQPAGPESSTLPRTALHAACQLGDVVMTQLLVWVGVASLMFNYQPFIQPYFDSCYILPSAGIGPTGLHRANTEVQ